MSLASDTAQGLQTLDKQGSSASNALDALMTQINEAKKTEGAIAAKNRELDQTLYSNQASAIETGNPVMLIKDQKTGQVGLGHTPQDMIDAVQQVKVNRVKTLMQALDPSSSQDQALPDPNAIGGSVSAASSGGAPSPTSATSAGALPPPSVGPTMAQIPASDDESKQLAARGINPKTYLFKPRVVMDASGNATPKFDTYEDQQKRADTLTAKVRQEQPAIPEYQNVKGTTKAAVDYLEPLIKTWDKTGKAPNLVAAQSTLESALTQVQMGIQSQVRAGLLNQTDQQGLQSYFNGLYTKATSGGKGLDKASMKTMLNAIKDLNDSHAEMYNDAVDNVKTQAKLNGVSPAQIDAVYPKAKLYYPSFDTETAARKAGYKKGSQIRLNGQKVELD